jgi:hypothetical protein
MALRKCARGVMGTIEGMPHRPNAKRSNFENYKQRFQEDNPWIPHEMISFSVSEEIDYTFDYGYVFEELEDVENLEDLDETNSG